MGICQLAHEGGRSGLGAGRVMAGRDGDERGVGEALRFCDEVARGGQRHRQDARSSLARAFGEQLLNPQSQIGELRGYREGNFVSPLSRHCAEECAQDGAGVLMDRNGGAAASGHVLRRPKDASDVHAGQGRGNEAEQRQGRVAAADVGGVQEDGAESVVAGDALKAGVWVGDGDEGIAGRGRDVAGPPPEVLEQGEHFYGAARLAGDDEEGMGQVYGVFAPEDSRRDGAVQHMESRAALRRGQVLGQHVGGQAATAHAEQDDVGEAGLADFPRKGLDFWNAGLHGLRNGEPTESVHDLAPVGRAPYGGVVIPDARNNAVPFQFPQGIVYEMGLHANCLLVATSMLLGAQFTTRAAQETSGAWAGHGSILCWSVPRTASPLCHAEPKAKHLGQRDSSLSAAQNDGRCQETLLVCRDEGKL